METFVDIISDIGAQISKIKRCRINQQTLIRLIMTGRNEGQGNSVLLFLQIFFVINSYMRLKNQKEMII